MDQASETLRRIVENGTGETLEAVRKMPLEERRAKIEKRLGRPLKFVSMFPDTGRAGSVLRDRILSREAADKELEQSIKDLDEALIWKVQTLCDVASRRGNKCPKFVRPRSSPLIRPRL